MFPDPNKNERFLTTKENLQIWGALIIINAIFWGVVLACI
jgi:hypothetical protein